MKPSANRCHAVIFFLLLAPNLSLSDDHILVERTRTSRGSVYPKRLTEIWLRDAAVSIKNQNTTTIYRFDLGTVWTIAGEKKLCLEEPLRKSEAVESSGPRDTSLHKVGYKYEPRYDWQISEIKADDTVRGYHCRRLRAEGNADFARKTIELWVTKEVPIDLQRFYRLYLAYTLEQDWLRIYGLSPGLSGSLMVKSIETQEPAIAPPAVIVTEVTLVETRPSPPGVYDLPAGCVKTTSIDDLYH